MNSMADKYDKVDAGFSLAGVEGWMTSRLGVQFAVLVPSTNFNPISVFETNLLTRK